MKQFLSFMASFFLLNSLQVSAKECAGFLTKAVAEDESNQLRDEIFQAALEIRSANTLLRMPFRSWKKNSVLRSEYALRTLIDMHSKLSALKDRSDRKDVVHSANLLLKFTNRRIIDFNYVGISYDWFHKLSFFYALHMDMLNYKGDNYYAYRVGSAIDYNEDFSVIMKHPDDVVYAFGLDSFYVIRSSFDTVSFDLNMHYQNKDATVAIPSTRNLDLEALYWLRARGIGVVTIGAPSDLQTADKFIGDFHTASGYYNRITSDGHILATFNDLERGKDFYNEIEQKISKSSKTQRQRIIKLALAYYLLTSNRPMFDFCQGVEYHFNGILENPKVKGVFTRAFKLSSYLKQNPPNELETRKSLEELKGIFQNSCKG